MWSFSTMWTRYQAWWRQLDTTSRLLTLAVALITAIGSIYRLYILPQTMQFLADQGRDALIAHGILHGDVALVGPSTSVGSMFLGPFYYYFMAPFIWLAGNNPLGPAYAVAFIGIVTIPTLYAISSRIVGRWPAFFATMLYAVGPFVNEYTRFSWNPNPAPIVSLGTMYATWRAWRGNAKWWIVVGALWALIIQLHYVAALVIVPSAIIFLADVWRARGNKRMKQLGGAFLWSAFIVVISFAPLVVFNWRFNNLIVDGFRDFAGSDTTSAAHLSEGRTWFKIFSEQQGRALQLLFEVWGGKDWTPWYRQINTALLAAYISILGIATFVATRKRKFEFGHVYLLLMLAASALGLAFSI